MSEHSTQNECNVLSAVYVMCMHAAQVVCSHRYTQMASVCFADVALPPCIVVTSTANLYDQA